MTQALASFDNHGLVLATDSRATRFTEGGQAEWFSVDKLFPLGRLAAVVSGGAGVSVPLSLALRHAIGQRRGLDDLEEMAEFALEFLTRGYSQHLRQHGPEPEGFRRIYFIMAGYSEHYPPPGYKLYLLGSEANEPLKIIPERTADFVFLRYIGHPDLEMNASIIAEWASQLVEWLQEGVQAYVFCHCPDERLDPWLCREFYRRVREKISIPALPWDEVDADAAHQARLF